MLQLIHSKESVFVTGTTGLAACAIGGTTVHSWAGIGLGKESAQELADKVWSTVFEGSSDYAAPAEALRRYRAAKGATATSTLRSSPSH